MNIISIQYYKSPVGDILLGSIDGKLCLADWKYRKMRTTIDSRVMKSLEAEYVEQSSVITDETIMQLKAYFSGTRKILM
jgi:methylated-DNA-[protein]-cysteine S-methyltransferase